MTLMWRSEVIIQKGYMSPDIPIPASLILGWSECWVEQLLLQIFQSYEKALKDSLGVQLEVGCRT
jgi:hypothetical protein